MWLVLNISVIGFLCVLFALRFNKKKFIRLREELLRKEKEEEEKNKENKNSDNVEEAEILIVDSNYKNKEENNRKSNLEENKENKNVNFEEEENKEGENIN